MGAIHPFLDKFIVTRIGNQVLANHFLHSFDQMQGDQDQVSQNVISKCWLAPVLKEPIEQVCELAMRIYGLRPQVTVDDAHDTIVMIVPSHLQFIFREVLKNAVSATMKQYTEKSAGPNDISPLPPPVHVLIRPGKFDVELRVSDQGGGMRQSVMQNIWGYGFSGSVWPPMAAALAGSEEGEEQMRAQLQMSGYGMGIPLSRHYAKFFGGDLKLSSVYGFGTDVAIILNRLTSLEARNAAHLGSSIDDTGAFDDTVDPSIFDLGLGEGSLEMPDRTRGEAPRCF